jgi:predicted carbohydrate-binding protein with CBM5 and CBM33 domain
MVEDKDSFMSGWNDPRFVITLLLVGLFGYAFAQDPNDEAMKGAIIAAFSTAYGFWLAGKEKEQSTANTGKALTAILNAQEAPAAAGAPRAAEAAGQVAEAAREEADEIAEDTTGRTRPFV